MAAETRNSSIDTKVIARLSSEARLEISQRRNEFYSSQSDDAAKGDFLDLLVQHVAFLAWAYFKTRTWPKIRAAIQAA